VQETWQVERMRHLYNDNLDMLSTKPLPYRTYEVQQEWWNENKKYMKAFLYEPIESPGKFVAFLLLRDRGGFYTPTIAIQKEEWGKKYGQEIIHDYIEKANAPLAGSQLQSNKAICHINKKVGWQILGETIQPAGKVDLLYHQGINLQLQNDPKIFKAILEYLGLKKQQS
jgi:RimJ/RimL family protein N-acetyltransferase